MTINNKNISNVISIIKDQIKDFNEPSVTMVGKKWNSPFLVLISCLLSLRTKDEVTLPASERLFELAKTPKELLALDTKLIEKTIFPVGFYKRKAAGIKDVSKTIIEDFDGEVPDNLDELLTLKGVGRKTANLVLTEGYKKLGICVDTHVHRISNRFGYVKTVSPNDTEQVLRKKLDKKHWIEYNALLVVWGQNICKPISPLCSICSIEKYCPKNGVLKRR
ncbi:MAG: endonuclease III [Omnitrophica WOR_2 bacterium GWF2_38_59]|nr:MAG: endonuclease III [Omnitrophica WOR_2 bacterium GWF2_38_59]OGX46758.1 MAG: endonuclease III [Omnitrophica WOR_2 bacterium RIFOXYA2_FULL_38_17]OGX53450.1 MAG: endonuclease III [Omnitrophica WOR_2 bacterium RIFOXYA12_FULL_38_10]OGX58851.1 MAG: endonuclease III [Omnitrophica WOR_2 bacterium RIFOXYC2_FULL_38_12]OGX59849.1 MAG: endonuclease III [Omnitrophica WOR_2 bacterium RIFOXYB2_FULL_38_16]HBG61987.1 endonuclease III [Candidatus Omnitrophota bacterium]